MNSARQQHLIRFYSILDLLEQRIGGALTLADCSGRLVWFQRGVYFFRELGERRTDTGDGPRIARSGRMPSNQMRARNSGPAYPSTGGQRGRAAATTEVLSSGSLSARLLIRRD